MMTRQFNEANRVTLKKEYQKVIIVHLWYGDSYKLTLGT